MRVRTPRTLTARLVATMVVLVTLASLLVITASGLVMNSYLNSRLDRDVAGALERAANPRRGPGDGDGDGPGFVAQGPGTLVLLVPASGASQGGLLTRSGNRQELSSRSRAELADVPADGDGHTVDLPVGDYRVAAIEDSAGNKLVVGRSTAENSALLQSLVLWSIVFSVAFAALAAVLGRTLVRRQLRPLRAVAATAHTVSQQPLSTGDPTLETRVDARHTDPDTEVGQVGSALNRLLDAVSAALADRHRSEQQVRQFVADASHELRTPLSTIHGYAELSRRTPDDPVALGAALAKVETETDRMAALVEDLLLLARLDSGRPLEREEVDVTRLLLESVADAGVVDPDRRWRLDLPDEPVSVTGDEKRLHQVVSNLLGNARHHTPPGTTVTVSATADAEHVVVHVHDDGPGLPAGLAPHAFERFTRGDSSRTRSSGGAGLGLSLVAAITEAHGGTAQVASQPGDTTFTVTLPR